MQNYKGALFDHVLFPGGSGVAWSQSRYQCLNKGSTEGPWTVCSEFLCKQPFAQCFPRNCPFHFEYPEQWVIVSITTWKTDPFLQNLYYDDSAAHCPALKKYTFHLFCSSIGTKLGSDCTPPPLKCFIMPPPQTPNRKGGGGYWFWCGSRRRPLSFLYALSPESMCGFWPNLQDTLLGRGKEVFSFWWPWPHFQGHISTLNCLILTKKAYLHPISWTKWRILAKLHVL